MYGFNQEDMTLMAEVIFRMRMEVQVCVMAICVVCGCIHKCISTREPDDSSIGCTLMNAVQAVVWWI